MYVTWPDCRGQAYWPVIVESQITLPPVDLLKDLPLDALIQILSSSQPLHRLLKIINKYKAPLIQSSSAERLLDAHQLVDTSAFLLQRIKRVSFAMHAFRQRLEKPVYSEESLKWRLQGPIGLTALVDAIDREAKSVEEKIFLISELAMELSRLKPVTAIASLPAEKVKTMVNEICQQNFKRFQINQDSENPIESYAAKAFQKASHEF